LVFRLARAPEGSDLRGQLGAFLLAALLTIGTAVIPDGDTITHLVLFLAAGVALPATVASAVVRHRLLDPQAELAARLDTLTAARTTLVTEREEERAHLRRELHDGLGPSLAAIGLGMRRLQSEVADPAQGDLVTTLADEVQRAVGEVRRICEGLRPEAVDELGLVAALMAAADRLGSVGGPSVTVEARPLPALPPAHEVAAYRVVMEAATNAVRHARADHVAVRICWEGGLLAEVEDDGRGIDHGVPHGVGLAAMADRADELGGSTTVEAAPGGGTVVRLRLPASRP
jgi:signal transduction histidine kinase